MSRLISCKATLTLLTVAFAIFTYLAPSRAAVIAHDNFESYTEGAAIVDQAGGTGWAQPWIANITQGTPVHLTTSGHIDGLGRSLELGATPENRHIAVRQFPEQTGDVYVGFTFQTTNGWDGDFFQIYMTNTYDVSSNSLILSSFQAGILNDPGMNRYFVRKGPNNASGTTVSSTLQHTSVDDDVHTFVAKFSKSTSMPGDLYDEVTLWIDQATEGTPTAFVDAAAVGNETLNSAILSVVHFRVSSLEADDRVYVDQLTIATTYDEALNGTSPTVAGDFDSDGDVDGADFVAWQTNFPTASGATLAQGDADGDGDVDGADFVVWQTNFPFTPGSGASPVPEPFAGGMALVGCALLLVFRRRLRNKI